MYLAIIKLVTLYRSIPLRLEAHAKYKNDKNEYIFKQKNNCSQRFPYLKEFERPCLYEYAENAGTMDSYFWQDLWAAKLILKQNPEKHYDIGSRIDGFIAHLAAFRENIYIIDVRPLEMDITGVQFTQADAALLEGIPDESIESISALCSLEHFGLGRYGDPIDPFAYQKAMRSIVRVLQEGGHAYISVPIGWEHLEFNAHRIFYASSIVELFRPLRLVEFSSACGAGFYENIKDIHKFDHEVNYTARFGLFHFVKESNQERY